MKNNIKHIRYQKNLSLCQVSELTGIHFGRLKVIEDEECHEITIGEWNTLALGMDTTIADLLDLPVLTIDEANNELPTK